MLHAMTLPLLLVPACSRHWSKTIEGRSNLDNCHVRVGILGAGEHNLSTPAAGPCCVSSNSLLP
jgi:hypothetical protein